MRLVRSLVLSIFLYGTECWSLKESDKRKILRRLGDVLLVQNVESLMDAKKNQWINITTTRNKKETAHSSGWKYCGIFWPCGAEKRPRKVYYRELIEDHMGDRPQDTQILLQTSRGKVWHAHLEWLRIERNGEPLWRLTHDSRFSNARYRLRRDCFFI